MAISDSIRSALSLQGSSNSFIWPNRVLGPGALYSDYERIKKYSDFLNIYWGNFSTVFRTNSNLLAGLNFDSKANIAARSIDALHSAILVEIPEVLSNDEPFRFFAQEFLRNDQVEMAVQDALKDVIIMGDGVLKLSVENNVIRMRSVNPSLYFPELRQPNVQEPQAHNLVWPEDDSNDFYLKERYWFNQDTQSWWLTITRFAASTGAEGAPIREEDLKTRLSPIIHCFANRVSGLFWGKAPLQDAAGLVEEYASTVVKIGKIGDMASTQALLTAPWNAFDDKGNLRWSADNPYVIDDGDLAAGFDKSKIGYIDVPGAALVEPNLAVLETLKTDIVESFGVTPVILGDAGSIRDTGQPALERLALLMSMSVNRHQNYFSIFLNQAVNVAADLARNHLSYKLEDGQVNCDFKWAEYAPLGDSEEIANAQAKVNVGLPKGKALEELGYSDGEQLAAQSATELAGAFNTIVGHSPYDPVNPDQSVQDEADRVLGQE